MVMFEIVTAVTVVCDYRKITELAWFGKCGETFGVNSLLSLDESV